MACAMVWLACACAPVACMDVVAACDAEAGERDPALPAAYSRRGSCCWRPKRTGCWWIASAARHCCWLPRRHWAGHWPRSCFAGDGLRAAGLHRSIGLGRRGGKASTVTCSTGRGGGGLGGRRRCAAACGLLRAELWPEADCALGWVAAWLLVWLVSAGLAGHDAGIGL